jgi:DNA processing protein
MTLPDKAARPAATPASGRLMRPDDPRWPRLWNQITDPPRAVQTAGDAALLAAPAVAIVGTRQATVRGLAFARALGSALAVRGWTIVSGLALGIDGAAHQGALDVGGPTVAVMATGLDRTYPRAHAGLRRRIEETGCVVTEFPVGIGPRKYHFPRRNRLIAGLVQAVVVVEAPLRSGALVTAYLALDYNREVFAVPGPVDLESSRGCHHLLREGATLLETAADLVAVLDPPAEKSRTQADGAEGPPRPPRQGSAARWIFDQLDFDGRPVEELRCRWAGDEAGWSEGMIALEMAGLIRRLPGGTLARSIW